MYCNEPAQSLRIASKATIRECTGTVVVMAMWWWVCHITRLPDDTTSYSSNAVMWGSCHSRTALNERGSGKTKLACLFSFSRDRFVVSVDHHHVCLYPSLSSPTFNTVCRKRQAMGWLFSNEVLDSSKALCHWPWFRKHDSVCYRVFEAAPVFK